jgi:hypothetical protein
MEANFLNLKKKHDEYLSLTMYFQLSKIYHKFLRGDFLINDIPIRRSLLGHRNQSKPLSKSSKTHWKWFMVRSPGLEPKRFQVHNFSFWIYTAET